MTNTSRVVRVKRACYPKAVVATVRDMIRMSVKELAAREGIDSPYALAQVTDLPYETCRRLWQGHPSLIGLSTIERLCDVLRVRPGQLFDYDYEPDKPRRKRRTVSRKK